MNTIVKINDELQVEVVTNVEHEWLLSTKDVAEGYGLSESGVRKAKERYADELEDGKHYVTDSRESMGRPSTMWTKRGVARLGFFIKTPMAKEFRDWAEDFIIEGGHKPSTPVIPQSFAEALMLAAQQAQAIELMTPKVATYDALMDPSVIPTITLTEAGKQLGYSQKTFFAMLRRDKIIYADSSCPKSLYDIKGYFKSTLDEKHGRTITSWRVTPSGLEFFLRKYGKKAV